MPDIMGKEADSSHEVAHLVIIFLLASSSRHLQYDPDIKQ